LNQSINLGISDGIGKIIKELGANNLAQVREIGEIKKSIIDDLHRFQQSITETGNKQINENKEMLRTNLRSFKSKLKNA